MEKKLYVLITVDMESYFHDLNLNKNLFNNEFECTSIMDICDMFDLKCTFFLNVYESKKWEKEGFGRICDNICKRGFDVQLHTHPYWMYDVNREHMHEYSLEEQKTIIKDGIQLLSYYTNEKPVAHRAGAYGANKDTIEALRQNGVKYDFSMFYGHPNCKINLCINKLQKNRQIIEMPVTVLKNNDLLTKFDVDWLVEDDLLKALYLLKKSSLNVVTLFLHSYSFLKYKQKEDVFEPDYEDMIKFIKVLDAIYKDDEIEVITVKEFVQLYEKGYFNENIRDTLLDLSENIIYPNNMLENILKDNNYSNNTINKINKYYLNRKNLIVNKLNKIFYRSSKKNIGIYGTGNHTEVMLKYYEKYIGKLDFNMFFFNSNSQLWGKNYLNRKIYNPKEIGNLNLNRVIISSFQFQEEIYKSIEKYKEKGINIVKIYEENEENIFSNYK
ncbi:hypothetical protein G8E05_04375 [Clostridium botulinum]|uniref:Polysaccharide deacetylase n=3 Tax=Clostridium botulinum TaxID=1491 RepID=A0A846HV49_CLOBO|nr:polysaccharide deacetylase family protein [Clostridium botulinum]AJD27192.1 polysaccharide deacetylase family protein [Clostridium botulinum CDC_297]ACQ52080.1 conserved hypothetical protein [Clostridium botulinum Ba4 str. 657]APR01919.1 polysaccharide deacetylase family protein [Clostridium botulinum]AUN04152.1 hypothetical protein RSJ19_15055 [Clostridium botulinum]AXG93692.1 hypothetical protein AGE29_18950 [Clostridium botulinum]